MEPQSPVSSRCGRQPGSGASGTAGEAETVEAAVAGISFSFSVFGVQVEQLAILGAFEVLV